VGRRRFRLRAAPAPARARARRDDRLAQCARGGSRARGRAHDPERARDRAGAARPRLTAFRAPEARRKAIGRRREWTRTGFCRQLRAIFRGPCPRFARTRSD
jgi:hypothetical protein